MTLDIRSLMFSYDGKRNVLDDISLSFKEGQFVVLLGRNGAGKTTLFRNLLGLLKADGGSVHVDGRDFLSMSVRERAGYMAYIPQESHPGFSYSVITSVLMGTTSSLSTLSCPGKKEMDRAYAALERFGLVPFAHRMVDSLSGGERQLVLCARAIAQGSRILLFDEPTSSLDWANQIRTLDTIRSLTREGYLAIVSTHNLEQALNWATRLVLLKGGRVHADGTSGELACSCFLSSFYDMDIRVEKMEGHYVCIPQESV